MDNTTQTAEEFEKDHITEYDTYYAMMEAYAKLKCLEQAETLFTEDQMYLFAGYCMGKRLVSPEKDAKEIMEEWKADFKYKSI